MTRARATSRVLTLALALALTACANKPSRAAPDGPTPAEPVVFVESPTDPAASRAPNPSDAEGELEAGADEPSERDLVEAKKLYAEGLRFYEQGDYTEALARWQQAYAIVRMPQLAFNIAKCFEALGRDQDACATYRELYDDRDAQLEEVAREGLARLGC